MSKAKIIIAEDELVIALSIKKSLEKLGYEVTDIVTSGEEAVEKALGQDPDLILMDIILSGAIDGIEAVRRIRKKADIPIIYLTANADNTTVDRARDTLPYGYLNKPINERDLLTNIDSTINKYRMERRISESEKKYRNLIENINDIIVSFEENGTITYISPQTYDISGYKAEEVIGNNIIHYVHPDDQKKLIHVLEKSKTGVKDTGEYRIISKTGDTLWMRVSGRPNFIDDRFVGIRAILSDITKQKKAEESAEKNEIARKLAEEETKRKNDELTEANEELQSIIEELETTSQELESQNKELIRTQADLADREALLQSIFRAAPTGIGMVKKRVISWSNKMLCIMTGYTEEELKGQSARILYPNDEDYEYVGREKYAQIAKKGTGSVETRWKRKDGSVIDVLLSSTPLDLNNLDAGVVFTALDITEQKNAGEEINHKNEELTAANEELQAIIEELEATSQDFEEQNKELKRTQADLANREALLQSIFRAAPTGIGIVYKRVIDWANKMLCTMTGYSEEELKGQSARILYPTDEDYEYVGREKYAQIAKRGTGSVETRWKQKDGTIIDVLLSSTPLDINNMEGGVVFTALDITEEKRIKRALVDSEEKYRFITTNIPYNYANRYR